MGLAEKRGVKECEEKQFPTWKKEVEKCAGFPVPIEVSWDTLAEPNFAHLYNEAFDKIFFQPLIGAFKSICKDKMGKEALKAALKKIIICNSGSFYSTSGFSFTEGVLKMDHSISNLDDVKERTQGLIELLEGAL